MTENNKNSSNISNDLCQKILNYEFEIDIGNTSEDNIATLIELYSEAINFYISRTDNPQLNQKRTKFYQDKIKRLLARNDIQKSLMGQKTNKKSIDLQHKLKQVYDNAEQQTKALFDYYKNQQKNQTKLIKLSVESQDKTLNERIARRSMSKQRNRTLPRKTKITLLD